MRILLERPPFTLNPRSSLDATGQRLLALMLGALTAFDNDLRLRPAFAESWRASADGREWAFRVRPGLRDHGGEAITPERLAACFENYRVGKPVARLAGNFRGWRDTIARGPAVVFRLDQPDAFLPQNVSLLRYFRVIRAGGPATGAPCAEPVAGDTLVGSGDYRAASWEAGELAPEAALRLVRPASAPGPENSPPLQFRFVQDESTRALALLNGEADAIQNALSVTKVRWIQASYGDRFRVLERDGTMVAYLAFNVRDPVLRDARVRRAIALAIDRADVIDHKMRGFLKPADSLLAPMLPESHPVPLVYDTAAAERLLDEAGYPRRAGGTRFRLRYKTTPLRDGWENALVLREMLGKVGVAIDLEVVEPAVFFASIRHGAFQLYSSRWVGVKDGSIYYTALRSDLASRVAPKPAGKLINRSGYHNPRVDELLDRAMAESALARRIPLLREVQEIAARELPFFPLWYWNTALVMRRGLHGLDDPRELSLSGGLEPLARLRQGPATR